MEQQITPGTNQTAQGATGTTSEKQEKPGRNKKFKQVTGYNR